MLWEKDSAETLGLLGLWKLSVLVFHFVVHARRCNAVQLLLVTC